MEELLIISRAVSALTLTANIALVLFLVLWIGERLGFKVEIFSSIKGYLQENALALSFVLALSSVLGSLFYSNVLGYEPCVLCWWARALLFPQALVLALAWPKKDSRIFTYLLPLSVAGVAIMAYNQALQMGWTSGSSLICGTDEAASCAVRFVFDYGFVTIPMMALTSFAWLIILGVLGNKKKEFNPEELENLHEVAITAIIVKNGKYLITRRSPSKSFAGRWLVPGGRLEQDDYLRLPKDTGQFWYNVLERTLRREVKEEVNLDIKNIEYVTSLTATNIRKHGAPALIISCLAEYAGGEVELEKKESDDYAWVTLEEAKQYDLVEGVYDELVMAEQQLRGTKREWERSS